MGLILSKLPLISKDDIKKLKNDEKKLKNDEKKLIPYQKDPK